MNRNAKVVCTLGPASDDLETIADLASAGMSVARFNTSHGTTAHRRTLIERVREIDERTDQPVATLLDLSGPEVRTAPTESSVLLADGQTVEFYEGDDASSDRVGLSRSIARASAGDTVLLDDGRIGATITDVDGGVVRARVDSGGELTSRSGVNLPGVDLELPAVTEEDQQELDLAAEAGVDFVAASFVRSADDVYEVSSELEARGVDIPIIAKIERADAVENIDDIIDAAYGIMVARGDLGVECPLEDVPIIQKQLVRQCHRNGVPVITATEMLDSMIAERRPTRAEASDVANAVLDGTDAVMLSGETAVGDHPVRVVETMTRIIEDVEQSDEYAELLEQRVPESDDTKTGALARSARFLASDVDAEAVITASESGYTARKAAKFRPNIPVVAWTPSGRVRRQLALSWGIIPQEAVHSAESVDAVIQSAVQAAKETGAIESGDTTVVLSGMMTELEGMDTANMLKVHVASETLASGRSVVDGYVTGPLYRVDDGDLSSVPADAIVLVPADFDGEFDGDVSKLAGLISEADRLTGYVAILARELGIPMVGNTTIGHEVPDGMSVTLDGEHGVIYADANEHR